MSGRYEGESDNFVVTYIEFFKIDSVVITLPDDCADWPLLDEGDDPGDSDGS